jgi:hypothetical protein
MIFLGVPNTDWVSEATAELLGSRNPGLRGTACIRKADPRAVTRPMISSSTPW